MRVRRLGHQLEELAGVGTLRPDLAASALNLYDRGELSGEALRRESGFTESDEQCVFTVELDGIRKEPNPLLLDLEMLEDAVTDSGALSLLKEELRTYFRKVLGVK